MEEKQYTVYVHVDESLNATPYGTYTWEEAGKRAEELLEEFPSVTWGGVRYYSPPLKSYRASLPQKRNSTHFAG